MAEITEICDTGCCVGRIGEGFESLVGAAVSTVSYCWVPTCESLLARAGRPCLHFDLRRRYTLRIMSSIRWAKYGGSFLGAAVVGSGLLGFAGSLLAQRGGGGSIGGGGATTNVGRPGGVEEKDELRGFHRAIAVQATSEQIAQFREIVKTTEAASRELDQAVSGQDAQASAKNAEEWGARASAVRQSLDTARTETGKFVNGFSLGQKTGLKENTAKLMKAESELGEQEKMLDAGGEAVRSAGRAEVLRKALANFRSEQENLAVEMGIVTAEGSAQVAFNIPARKSSVTIGGQTVGITTSAVVTRTSDAAAPGGESVYKVEATTDLAELQENIGAILGATMNKEDRCGERIRVKETTLTPEIPLGIGMARLHYERWVCSSGYGGNREMTEGNATVDMKLTAGMGADGQLKISSEIVHVEAERFFADLLKSGTLGAELNEKMSSAVMAAVANLKMVVPAAGDTVTARSVRFESLRENELSVVVGGEMRMSEAQAKEMERLGTAGTVATGSKAQ
jgi:hypothetical protein